MRVFVERLLDWFQANMRPLPWRRDYTPYAVWISEIMLQQTQMERGVRYFLDWMRRFPDIASVARAHEEEILASWEGLGYYSRARNLHAAAQRIMTEHRGAFPSSPAAIRALPGVGEYTAGAIGAIAFNLPEPAVDANVLRIFSRIGDISVPVSDKTVRERVAQTVTTLLHHGEPRLLCQGLMEFGALVCTKTPQCAGCPFVGFCQAYRRGTVSDRPVKKAKPGYSTLEMTAGVVMWKKRVYIRKRPSGGLWSGLWEFPCGQLEAEDDPEKSALRFAEKATGLPVRPDKKIGVVRHGYTTWRVTLHGFLCQAPDEVKPSTDVSGKWISPREVGRYAFPAGHRKLLERLGWKTGAGAEVEKETDGR